MIVGTNRIASSCHSIGIIALKNEPAQVSGQLPDNLASGGYHLVIRTQVGTSGNRFLKEVRTSISDLKLEVE